MLHLTGHERTVLWTVMFLLLTGWAVKTWRTAQPPVVVIEAADPEPNAHR
jgi:hypothetical protein